MKGVLRDIATGRHGARGVALVALLLVVVVVPWAAADSLARLKVNGRYLVDESGAKVTLRGCNLGNWLLIEPWMLGLDGERFRDQYTFVQALQARFGPQRAAELLDLYRDNWITARELALIKSFGFNLVRVPFHYGLLMDDERPGVLREDAFKWLDRAVDLSEQAGCYVILDLHGAPGGQSVDGPTGRAGVNALWDNPKYQEQTAWLWQRIAEHYRNRPAVVAYDVLNEPWGDFRTDVRARLVELIGRLHAAIREVDPDKLIFAPGSLRGITFYGNPREHGWKNVGFTEHFYPGVFGRGAATLETHAQFFGFTVPAHQQILEQLDVPYLVGEFNVVFDRVAKPEMMRRYYDEFGASGWLATMWSARLINPPGGVKPDNWYLITNAQPFKLPDLGTASYEEFERAFRQLGAMELAADNALWAALTAPQANRLLLATFADAALGTPPADIIPGWTSVDIAASPAGGAKLLPGGALKLYGSGGDIWGNRDEFRFVYRETAGDFTTANRLTALTAPHPFAKAGWMLRESLAPDAAHVLVHAFADGRVMLAWRAERGGLTQERTLAISGLPVGLGLERSGQTIQVRYTDADGNWCRQPVPADVHLPDKALLGLIILSHDDTTLATATFDGLGASDIPPITRKNGGSNLLQNASFENTGDAADRARQWDRWGEWFNREQDWKPQREGRCVLGYHHWQIESAEDSGVYQDVTGIKPGTRCTFDVYANRDVPADGKHGPEAVELRIESRLGDRLLTVASQTYAAKNIAAGDGWSRLQVTGTIPADNVRVLIIVQPSREGPRDAAVKVDQANLCVIQESGALPTASINSRN